jgi:hypothetical protein
MNRNEFNRFIAGIDLPGHDDLEELRELVALFPWFHSAHMLLLRGLRENSDIRFDSQLKASALSVADREVLYHYLFLSPAEAVNAAARPGEVSAPATPPGEVSAPAEAQQVEETPAVEEVTAVEEAPLPEEVTAVEEAPLPEEVPAVEEAPVPEEVPAVEEAPLPEEVPAVDEAPLPEEFPAVEEVTAVDEAPLPEEVPAVEDIPAPEEAPDTGAAPVPEESPVAEEVPSVEGTHAAEETPVVEEAVETERPRTREDLIAEIEARLRELEQIHIAATESVTAEESEPEPEPEPMIQPEPEPMPESEYDAEPEPAELLELIPDEPVEVTEPSGKLSQADLIDRFIRISPTIERLTPGDMQPVKDLAAESTDEHGKFITETLAKIYINQGYYTKAINIYEKLSLQYPEKSAYFASRIEKIKELIK